MRKFFRTSSRFSFFVVIVIIGIILIAFGDGRSQASNSQNVSAIQRKNNLPSSQAYQFTGQGRVLGGSDRAWMVGGVQVIVPDGTQIEDSIHPGDTVSLLGHITKNGSWIADQISLISEDISYFQFIGPLESVGEKVWQVAGIRLAIGENSNLGDEILPGELVLTTFQVQPDGTWLAIEIQALTALEKARLPSATPTMTSMVTPFPEIAPADDQGGNLYNYDTDNDDKYEEHDDHGKGKGEGHEDDHDDENEDD